MPRLCQERIDSIDKIQGQESDLVVISFVRSRRDRRGRAIGAGKGTAMWLQDIHRLNVAVTRAKLALTLVGDRMMLESLRGNTRPRPSTPTCSLLDQHARLALHQGPEAMTTGPTRKGPRQASRAARRPVRADDGNTYQVRIRRGTVRARPDDVQLDLDWGFVPMLLWRSLPVLMLRSEQISLVERFTLMAATELGALSAEELSALTALPQRAVRPLLGRPAGGRGTRPDRG